MSLATLPSVYIGLGANLGVRISNLRRAVQGLERVLVVDAVSSLYESVYVGPGASQPDYLNAVLVGRTHLDPLALLDAVHLIEQDVGRQPRIHMMPRVLDLDILYYSNLWLRHPRLTLPHPRILERQFVLQPLNDLGALPHNADLRCRDFVKPSGQEQRVRSLGSWEEVGKKREAIRS